MGKRSGLTVAGKQRRATLVRAPAAAAQTDHNTKFIFHRVKDHKMFTTRLQMKAAIMASVLAVMMTGIATADPSKGGSCATCHTKCGGQLTVNPDPANIQLASNGLLTFKVTSLHDDDSVISIQGLDNPLLQASIGSKCNKWTYKSTTKYGASYVSNTIDEKGSYLLSLAIGAGATPGMYPITVMFADEEKGCTTFSFNLTVGQGVPEPATFGLCFIGLAAAVLRRTKR